VPTLTRAGGAVATDAGAKVGRQIRLSRVIGADWSNSSARFVPLDRNNHMPLAVRHRNEAIVVALDAGFGTVGR
jgi:hypothetical protein